MDNYQLLLHKVNAFTRKYYTNQLLRGALLLLIGLLAYVLLASVSEYFMYWPSAIRYGILGLFISVGLAALAYFIVLPLMHMARLGKVLNAEQAAVLIGKHFPEVQDKLLNILQLHHGQSDQQSQSLIIASIDQKAKQISTIPLSNAIKLSKNKKYLPYLLPLLLIGIFLLVAAPNVFRDASERLLQPDKSFAPPAPFKFYIQKQPLSAVYNQDFTLKAWVAGKQLPKNLSIKIGKDRLLMKPLGKDSFQYVFKNITSSTSFQLEGSGFLSDVYTVKVAHKPILSSFRIQLTYPAYTGRKNEVRTSLGDVTVPAGTKVQWGLLTEHTDKATIKLPNAIAMPMARMGNLFVASYSFFRDTSYVISLLNQQTKLTENMGYRVSVIPDQSPSIQVQEFRDKNTGNFAVLTGSAGDDYGISRVLFHYQILNDNGAVSRRGTQSLAHGSGAVAMFQHQLDINALNLLPGQKVNYFIEAWDNDAFGSKSARSHVFSYAMYQYKELDSVLINNANELSSGLSNSAQQTQQISEEFKNLQTKLLSNSQMDMESEQALKMLSEKQNDLKAELEKAREKLDEQMKQSKNKELSQDMQEKQEELKKQMDNLLNKELQDMMKKIQELMAKKEKQNSMQSLQELQQQNKLFNMDLERMQELMKKLEAQLRMEDAAAKAEKLAAEQENLKHNTDQKTKSATEIAKEQAQLKKKLEELLTKDMKDIKELTKNGGDQKEVNKMEEQGKEAGAEMDKSGSEISKGNNSKSSEAQDKAAKNLNDMAAALKQAAGGQDMEQVEIDIKATRQILTNLIRLSFDQEQLMKKVATTNVADASYLTNAQDQKRLHATSKVIKDSLFSLSKRIFKLAATVNKETSELEINMRGALEALEGRRVSEGQMRQQYVMTHTNNLALMLNELLSNLMQMQAEGQKGGKGSCNNPGGQKPGKKPGQGMSMQLSDVITKQQSMGQGIGKSPGQNGQQPNGSGNQGKPGGKPGEGKPGEGEYGSAEQLARTAAQQAAIRQQLQEITQMLNSQGMGDIAKELREVQKNMDRNETDLVNKKLGGELLLRQQDILTRLLKAEKSVREQEQDDKRSSKAGEAVARQIPAELQQMLLERQRLLEVYKTVPIELKPYYKEMVERYYKNVSQ